MGTGKDKNKNESASHAETTRHAVPHLLNVAKINTLQKRKKTQ